MESHAGEVYIGRKGDEYPNGSETQTPRAYQLAYQVEIDDDPHVIRPHGDADTWDRRTQKEEEGLLEEMKEYGKSTDPNFGVTGKPINLGYPRKCP